MRAARNQVLAIVVVPAAELDSVADEQSKISYHGQRYGYLFQVLLMELLLRQLLRSFQRVHFFVHLQYLPVFPVRIRERVLNQLIFWEASSVCVEKFPAC